MQCFWDSCASHRMCVLQVAAGLHDTHALGGAAHSVMVRRRPKACRTWPWSAPQPPRLSVGRLYAGERVRSTSGSGGIVDDDILPPALQSLVASAGDVPAGGAALRSGAFWQFPALPRVLEACSVSALHSFGDAVDPALPARDLSFRTAGLAGGEKGWERCDLDREFRDDCEAVAATIERCAENTERMIASTRAAVRRTAASAASVASWRKARRSGRGIASRLVSDSRDAPPWASEDPARGSVRDTR